jgi:hypothetical protein
LSKKIKNTIIKSNIEIQKLTKKLPSIPSLQKRGGRGKINKNYKNKLKIC